VDPEYVLDASALLALVRGEPGSQKVAGILDRCSLSAVNLAEVVTKLLQKGAERAKVESLLGDLELNVVPWTESLAYASAEFAGLAWQRGFSLGDRACLTLAAEMRATAVTCERAWEGMPVQVMQIR